MKTEDGGKAFDCVKWTRQIRDQIHEETAGMSQRGAAGVVFATANGSCPGQAVRSQEGAGGQESSG